MELAISKGLDSGFDLNVFIERMPYLFSFLSSVQLDSSPVLSSSSKKVKEIKTLTDFKQ